jgi:Tfp pilus assembly protein PilF
MSLLLEALKKAEKAKEEAQRRAREEQASSKPDLRVEDAAEAKPVMTRAELPDIRQPLEILSDDISPRAKTPPPGTAAPAMGAAPRAAASQESRAAERGTASAAPERAAARKVFEAKIREPNPRLPFFITMGALGAFAIGTAVYFWIQLRPPSLLANPNPGRPAAEAQASAAVPEAKPAAPAAASTGLAAIPGLPGTAAPHTPAAAAPAPSAAAAPAVVPAVPAAPAASTQKPPPIRPATAAPSASAPAARQELAFRQLPAQVHPRVEAAYGAYLAGDVAAARKDYEQVLREEPANRDAMLGLAALDVRAGRYESAEATYLRLLQSDPRDAHAQAGLLALRSPRMDPIATESRVKTLLAADPSAHILNFTLGNQLAQQGRWAEAQQEYFKAFSAEPDNADFAYNLAVSLDQLRQSKLALDYYRRAIALAEKRAASFDLAGARERAVQLSK